MPEKRQLHFICNTFVDRATCAITTANVDLNIPKCTMNPGMEDLKRDYSAVIDNIIL